MREVELHEVCDVIAGQSPPSSTYNQDGIGVPFFQGKADFGEKFPTVRYWCTEPKKFTSPGDLLFSLRAPVGPTNFNQVEASIGRGLAAIRCREGMDVHFLRFYFLHNEEKIEALGNGSTFKAITNKTLKALKVPLLPLEEQKRIAGILDEADRVRKKTQALIDKYDELAQSLFLDMFGDPVTNPKGWSVVGLSEICEYFIGLTYKPSDKGEFGIPVLRSGNVQNGQLDFSDLVRVTCQVKEKIELRKGDILMCSRNGSARLVGKCAVVNDLDEKMTFGAFMTVLRTEHTRFIEHFLRLPAFRRQIATGATTTVNQITKNMLDRIALPLPPRALELQFSSMIEELEKQRETSRKELNQQQNLFNALLQKAFKGELT